MTINIKDYVCIFRSGAYYKRIEDIFKCQINCTTDLDKATRLSKGEAEIVESKYGATKKKICNIKNEKVI